MLTLFTLYLIHREWFIFIHDRYQFLLSQQHSKLAQSKTVLITNLPTELANSEEEFEEFSSFFPEGIAHVWIYHSCPGLPDQFDERLDACKRLEVTATDMMELAINATRKAKSSPALVLAAPVNKDDQAPAAAAEGGNIKLSRFLATIARLTDSVADQDTETMRKDKVGAGVNRAGIARDAMRTTSLTPGTAFRSTHEVPERSEE
jgi:hypothetical protein